MTTIKPHPPAPWDRKPKPRRYVTRWLLAYEIRNSVGQTIQHVTVCATRRKARIEANVYSRCSYIRNIMPPQAVKVRVS